MVSISDEYQRVLGVTLFYTSKLFQIAQLSIFGLAIGVQLLQ